MRILFIGHSPHLSGAEFSLLRLIKHLAREVEIEVMAPAGGAFEQEVRQAKLPFYSYNPVYPFKLKKDQAASAALPFLEQIHLHIHDLATKLPKPDLIHSNTSLIWEGALLAAAWNIPHVWNLREILSQSPSWLPLFGLEGQYEWMNAMSDALVCNSHALADSLPLREKTMVKVIHNGLDEPDFLSREDAREYFLEQWQIPKDAQVVMTIGHFIQEKGHDFILPMIPSLVKQYPKLKFLWIGEHHWQYPEVHRQLTQMNLLDSVIMPGAVNHAAQYLKGADAYLLSSSTEAFPTVVLEALWAKVPVLARDCGGTREILEHGGGKVYPLTDTTELKKDLELLLGGRWNPPPAVTFPFTMTAMGEQYIKLYSQCLANYHPQAHRQILSNALMALAEDITNLSRDVKRTRTWVRRWPVRKLWRLGYKLGWWGDLPFPG